MNIIITGGTGFLGKHLVTELQNNNYTPIAYGSNDFDLRDKSQVAEMLIGMGQIDVLFHLAATVGGIGANRLHPWIFFYDNLMMGLNIIEQAIKWNVKKLVMVGTTCSYPKHTPIPFSEYNLYDGYPEETNAPYGIAKRTLLAGLKSAQDECGLNYAYIIPTNMYGPGDNFENSTSHVIPALIKKCLSEQDEIEVWGTGRVTRDFIYVSDVAKALVLAMEHYNRSEPLNVGSGKEVKISELLYHIVTKSKFNGKINWDTSKPDGQPRRALNIRNAKDALKWQPEVDLKEGLQRTIDWYKENILSCMPEYPK